MRCLTNASTRSSSRVTAFSFQNLPERSEEAGVAADCRRGRSFPEAPGEPRGLWVALLWRRGFKHASACRWGGTQAAGLPGPHALTRPFSPASPAHRLPAALAHTGSVQRNRAAAVHCGRTKTPRRKQKLTMLTLACTSSAADWLRSHNRTTQQSKCFQFNGKVIYNNTTEHNLQFYSSVPDPVSPSYQELRSKVKVKFICIAHLQWCLLPKVLYKLTMHNITIKQLRKLKLATEKIKSSQGYSGYNDRWAKGGPKLVLQ